MIFREETKKTFLNALDATILGKYAFETIFPDESKATSFPSSKLKVTYIGDSGFFFQMLEKYDPDIKKNGFQLQYSPGKFLQNQETSFVTEFPLTLVEFKEWLVRLVTDIKGKSPLLNKVYEEIHRIEEEFEKKINEKFEATESSYFSQEEVSELKDKIDMLYTKFEKLKEDQDIKDSELKAIKQELEKLKGTLPILPKEAWYKSSGKKIINLIGKYINPETVKSIATEVVKGLLGNNK